VKENYDLRVAKDAIQADYEALINMVKEMAASDHRHLNAKDKMETDWGLLSLTAAYQIAIRGNSLEMAQAVKQAIKGTFFIVSRCGVSASAKKYWDLKSHGPGGQKSGVSKQTNAGKWQDRAIKWLDGRTRKSPALKCATLARACKKACVDIPIGEKSLAEFLSRGTRQQGSADPRLNRFKMLLYYYKSTFIVVHAHLIV
jgi:hypothetical protein